MRTPSHISKLLATASILLLWMTPLQLQFLQAQNNQSPQPLEPSIEDPDAIIDLIVLTDETAIQVLELLEQLTGKIILRRQDIPATKINFNSRGPLKKSEAILALESLLSLNGIMLTDMGGRFLKAVPAANPSTQVPNMIMGSTLEKESSQQIYAKLFKLNYLVADQTTTAMITPFLSPSNSLTVFEKSNAFLITDALINLQRIESLIAEMDKPEEIREEIEFIKLEFIQAKDMEGQLSSLIDGSLKSYLQGNTKITTDERTNQLIVVTHPRNLELIYSVIENIDIDAAPLTASEVYPLKQAKAEEVVKIIDEIITGQRKSREEDAKTSNTTEIRIETAASTENTNTNNSNNASLQFSDFVGLSADDRTNAIVAYGTQQDLKTIQALIEKIDVPLPQVRIEAIITEVRLSENQSTGLENFNLIFDTIEKAESLGTKLQFSNSGVQTSTIIDSSSGTATTVDAPIHIGNFTLTGLLEIAEEDSDVKVLSTPSIVVSHNEEGVINVSESRPIVTGSTSSVTTTGSSTSLRDTVEYRDIGIQLEVTPLIGSDGSIQIEIEQSADQIAGSVEVNDNAQPIIGKREANSTITVQNGEIAVLAGLQQNKVDNSGSYFPLIGRLPLLKNILSGTSKNYDRTELIIFIRPTIVRNPSEAEDITSEILENYEEGETIENYLETGTIRDIYMKGSRLSPKKKDRSED
jgi:general secretion pathway protein D